MKRIRKIAALVLAAVMVMAMGITAFAATDGSIIVTNATKGQTYEAYLIFTASPSNPEDETSNIIYTATPAQVAISGFDTYFDKALDEEGNYSITKKAGANDEELIQWVKNNFESLKQGDAIDGTWTDNDTYTFSGLDYGYYYITSSLGSVVTIDTAGKNVAVVDKNESTPTGPEKKITAEDSAIDSSLDQSGISVANNDTSVGSTETFTVTFNATNWVKSEDGQTPESGTEGTKVTKWNFTDTPEGLDIDASTVKIYVNGTDAAHDVTSTVTNINVDADGVLTFTIPWVDGQGKHLYPAETPGSELIPVTIVYNAKINADAATAVAPNEVVIKYNDDTQVGDKAVTDTYTYKFKLEKKDEKGNALKGAEFELYFAPETGNSENPLKFVQVEEGVYRYDPEGTVTVTHIKPAGTDATAKIIGLDNTSYTLKEVVVPKGYNKAADQAVSGLSRVDAEETSITTITITNLKGAELPSTGGMGTTIFYVVGAVLVIGAGVVLIARRRMNSER
ncbi:MAG: LPXTG cell wall anchor domain-containing protein [Lachnospiraceae bacterium]|nr:LPXTG cell wall anchor domain-containing protein [Lachnospiraceae bacterium]